MRNRKARSTQGAHASTRNLPPGRVINPDNPNSYDYGWVAIPPARRLSNGKCESCGRLECRGLLSCLGASAEEFIAFYEADGAKMRKTVRDDPARRRQLQEDPGVVIDFVSRARGVCDDLRAMSDRDYEAFWRGARRA